jgi:hypothetical protein
MKFAIGFILCLILTSCILLLSGCGYARFDDGNWHAQIDTVLKDPKVGCITVLHFPNGPTFVKISGFDDNTTVTAAGIASALIGIAKIVAVIP